MCPKNSPASERLRASALSASAASSAIRPLATRASAPRSTSREHVALGGRRFHVAMAPKAARARTRSAHEPGQPTYEPAVVDEVVDACLGACLERIEVAARDRSSSRSRRRRRRAAPPARRTRDASARASSGPGTWQRVVWNTTTSNEPSSSGRARASPSTKLRFGRSCASSRPFAMKIGDGSTPTTSPTPGGTQELAPPARGRSRLRRRARRREMRCPRSTPRASPAAADRPLGARGCRRALRRRPGRPR